LRRALKFKATVFLLAWFAIFAHNVIPHNHLYDNSVTCMHFAGDLTKADKAHSDEQSCNLSNLLYHTLNPDVFLAGTTRDINFIPDLRCAGVYIDNDHSNNSDHLNGISLLRAPPSL
jgi:hypothetical protein